MSLIVYNIVMRIYQALITLASPFHPKAKLWVEGRNDYFVELQRKMYKNTSPIIWFHCASLGEFEQSRPLIEEIKNQYPAYNILLTFFSPSGFEVRKNYDKATYVFYLPLDTHFNARKFIRVVNPKLVLFAKYEFWHYYITELNQKKIPVISFSAIFRKDQIFFKPYGSLYRDLLGKFNKIFVQNEESINLLKEINITNTELAGDTRFDRVKALQETKKTFPLIEKFKDSKKLLVVGSSWEKDIDVLLPIINDSQRELKIIIAPHEIDEKKISSMEKRIKRRLLRFSEMKEETITSYEVLIINNVGILSSLYQYADFAYVGGAFEKGLHNTLEPATFGIPIFFGPHYQKFQEAKDLIQIGSAFPVENSEQLKETFELIYQSEEKRHSIAQATRSFINRNIGATNKILNYCKQFLN